MNRPRHAGVVTPGPGEKEMGLAESEDQYSSGRRTVVRDRSYSVITQTLAPLLVLYLDPDAARCSLNMQ